MISLVCLTQGDVKCLIAYSSVARFVGFISITKMRCLGSYLMIISHGLFLSSVFSWFILLISVMIVVDFFLNKGLIL